MTTKQYFENRKDEHLKLKERQLAELQRVTKAIDEIADIGNGEWKISYAIRNNNISRDAVRLYVKFTSTKSSWINRMKERNIFAGRDGFYCEECNRFFGKTDEHISHMLFFICKEVGFYP